MSLVPKIQSIGNDAGFFDYSNTLGENLYEIVEKKKQFKFKTAKGYCVGFRHSYPVYAVTKVESTELVEK